MYIFCPSVTWILYDTKTSVGGSGGSKGRALLMFVYEKNIYIALDMSTCFELSYTSYQPTMVQMKHVVNVVTRYK